MTPRIRIDRCLVTTHNVIKFACERGKQVVTAGTSSSITNVSYQGNAMIFAKKESATTRTFIKKNLDMHLSKVTTTYCGSLACPVICHSNGDIG